MHPSTFRRVAFASLVTAFALSVIAYAAIWLYYVHLPAPNAYLGIDYRYVRQARCIHVAAAGPDTPAARAGLRPGDCIVAVDGQATSTPLPFFDRVVRGQPGDEVRFTVRRDRASFDLEVTLAARPRRDPTPTPMLVAEQVVGLYPIPFVLVGLAVLALRPYAREAWLLALLFTAFAVGPLSAEPVMHPVARRYAAAYNLVMSGFFPALFYYFMAVFPAPSVMDRRVPWLKRLLMGVAACLWIPAGALVLAGGSSWALWPAIDRIGEARWQALVLTFHYSGLVLGIASLVLNCVRAVTPEAQRKARLIAWSFALAYLPWVVLQLYAFSRGTSPLALPFVAWAPTVVMLMLLPLLFAYTVIRHRVLELSVLLKRSARYLLVQRGFVVLSVLVSVGVTLTFAVYGARWLPRLTDAVLPTGIAVGAAFGLAMMLTGSAVARRVTPRIDRAFFRSAYDAQQVLEDLAERAATISSREELARLLDEQLREALHPARLFVYLRTHDGPLVRFAASESASPASLDPGLDVVQAAARQGHPWDVLDPVVPEVVGTSPLAAVGPECLVPILGRARRVAGLLVLGPRMSDEPYSRTDKRLLASIASQAGIALESLALAEDMADRLEAERRAARELEIAAEVQRRLLPQARGSLQTGEYDGRCLQARAIGGDYYDFIDLGPGQLGLVLADVSGKGLYAALLVANLQAQLRSLSVLASESLPRWLESVNHAFFESTSSNHYATLFMGLYDDHERLLRYANCGHLPPVLRRRSGTLERLEVTAGAVGLFDKWSCRVNETRLSPGDLLVVASDGVTEATSPAGDEFGETRLTSAICAAGGRSAAEVIDSIISTVRAFTGGDQTDDLTLVVLRAC